MEPKKQNRPTFAFYIALQHSALLTGESGGDFMERSGNKLFPQVGFAEQNFFMPDSYKFYPTFVTKWTHKKEKDIVEMWNNHFFQCTVQFRILSIGGPGVKYQGGQWKTNYQLRNQMKKISTETLRYYYGLFSLFQYLRKIRTIFEYFFG